MNWCARLLTLIGICNPDVIDYQDFKSGKSITNADIQCRWIANPPKPRDKKPPPPSPPLKLMGGEPCAQKFMDN